MIKYHTAVQAFGKPSGQVGEWRLQEAIELQDLGLSRAELQEWLKTMLLARAIDIRGQALFRQGRARFVTSWAGHEAAQVGVAWALTPGRDWIAPYYRDAALCFRMGLSPLDQMLSVLAKPGDPASGGKQTPGHFSSRRLNILSGGSPLATQLVHACGVAWKLRSDNEGAIILACYGDGAGSEGDAHEAFNFAAIHRLPVIFVCQNNAIAISTPFSRAYAVPYAAQRALGYGFPGVTVDGRDPAACYKVTTEAVRRAREGGGPTLIECLVDRLGGHTSEDDQSKYRAAGEVEQAALRDPVERFRQLLTDNKLITTTQLHRLDEEVHQVVDTATRDALAAADAEADDALSNVYDVSGVPEPISSDADAVTNDLNMVQALTECLRQEMDRDDRVMVLGEDVAAKGGVFLVTDGLWRQFGDDRVIDTPIAESSIAGVALGLALAGQRPVAEMQFADFAHCAFNQIVNEIAKFRYRTDGDWSAPLVIRAPMGGHAGGALYHSQSIEARFATPGLKIVIPSTPREAKGLLLAAIRDPDPVLFLEHKRLYRADKEAVPEQEFLIPIGPPRIVKEGTDVSVFTYGLMVHYAIDAAKRLEVDGWSIEIIDVRTVYPLPEDELLMSAKKTGKCLIVYEENFSVAIGSEIAAVIAQHAWEHLDAPVVRLGGLNVPAMPYAKPMEEAFMPTPEKIYQALRQLAEY